MEKKKKLSIIVGAIIVLIILVVWVGKVGVSFRHPVRDFYETGMSKNPRVKEVEYLKMGKLYLYKYSQFEKVIPEEDVKNLDDVMQVMAGFNYSNMQNNPHELKETGYGNCQALTLYADALFDKIGVKSDIVVEGEHMYNTIMQDGKITIIDFAKGRVIDE